MLFFRQWANPRRDPLRILNMIEHLSRLKTSKNARKLNDQLKGNPLIKKVSLKVLWLFFQVLNYWWKGTFFWWREDGGGGPSDEFRSANSRQRFSFLAVRKRRVSLLMLVNSCFELTPLLSSSRCQNGLGYCVDLVDAKVAQLPKGRGSDLARHQLVLNKEDLERNILTEILCGLNISADAIFPSFVRRCALQMREK